MRRVYFSVVVFSVSLFFNHYSIASDGVQWMSMEKAKVESKKSPKKPIFVIISAPSWCGACKKMKSETFKDPKVIKALGGFASVEMDVDTDEGAAFAQKYKAAYLPTYIFLNPGGESQIVLDKTYDGFMKGSQFRKLLKKARKKVPQVASKADSEEPQKCDAFSSAPIFSHEWVDIAPHINNLK